jgi:hypothetical protein
MDTGAGVDTSFHRDGWKDGAPLCEIVCIDFDEARERDAKAARTGKQSTYAPVWSAGVVDAARWNGDAGNRGRPVWSEVSTSLLAVDRAGVGQGRMTVDAG